jgi:hypothetical protein
MRNAPSTDLPTKQTMYAVEWSFPGDEKTKFTRLIVAPDFEGLKKVMNKYGAQSFAAEVASREVFA